MRSVDFFRTAAGSSPVETFLDSLPSKDAKKIAWVLQLVEELDDVPSQYLKKLPGTDNLWEIRVQVGRTIYRFLGFFENHTHFLVTCGFKKKGWKLPREQLGVAETRKREHLARRSRA